MPAGHRFDEHTSEVELTIEADTLPELYAQAGRALAELLVGTLEPPPAAAPVLEVELEAADAASLLVDWLNELLYRTEVERTVFTELVVELPEAGRRLRARLRGLAEPAWKGEVKAATLHQASVAAAGRGYRGHVILDV
jgi:SHS2 domain-containing protein